jgi:hypothetical protein
LLSTELSTREFFSNLINRSRIWCWDYKIINYFKYINAAEAPKGGDDIYDLVEIRTGVSSSRNYDTRRILYFI